jgi:hypothetical protein
MQQPGIISAGLGIVLWSGGWDEGLKELECLQCHSHHCIGSVNAFFGGIHQYKAFI